MSYRGCVNFCSLRDLNIHFEQSSAGNCTLTHLVSFLKWLKSGLRTINENKTVIVHSLTIKKIEKGGEVCEDEKSSKFNNKF